MPDKRSPQRYFPVFFFLILLAASMALLCCVLLGLLCISVSGTATLVADVDYGGVPLWIDRQAGEPSVLSLQGRIDPAWIRATNPETCPQQCDCPIQWPTAIYCDQRGLTDIPHQLPERTQYLFLQVRKMLTQVHSCICVGVLSANGGFALPTHTFSLCCNCQV